LLVRIFFLEFLQQSLTLIQVLRVKARNSIKYVIFVLQAGRKGDEILIPVLSSGQCPRWRMQYKILLLSLFVTKKKGILFAALIDFKSAFP
jgi:hypothetical protein